MQNYIAHQEERILLAYIKLKLSITAGINLWAAVPGSDVCLQRFLNDDECLGWTCSAESFYTNQVAQSGSVSALIFSCWEEIYVFVSLKHTQIDRIRGLFMRHPTILKRSTPNSREIDSSWLRLLDYQYSSLPFGIRWIHQEEYFSLVS